MTTYFIESAIVADQFAFAVRKTEFTCYKCSYGFVIADFPFIEYAAN